VLPSLDEALALTDAYAPEHLIIAAEQAADLGRRIHNAGSVFLGHLTPVSVGDYASGTNHTLPTNMAAYAYSGVSVDSFIKKITFQQLSPEGLRNIGPIVEQLAVAEQLTAHQDAVGLRLKSLNQL
jgi:histidinol dehydrogenase